MGIENYTVSPATEVFERVIKDENSNDLFDNLQFDNIAIYGGNQRWIPILETFEEFIKRQNGTQIQIFTVTEDQSIPVKKIYDWILSGQPHGTC